jgi:succinoglycan biosynthesis transport protein ExoP
LIRNNLHQFHAHDHAPMGLLPEPPRPSSAPTNVRALARLARGAWRQWWVLAGAMIAAIIIAGIYLLAAPRVYTSTARLYVEPGSLKAAVVGLGPGARAGSISPNFLNTQSQLIRSTPVLALALAKPGVDSMRTFDGVKNALTDLRQRLSVNVGANDDILSVSFDSRYAEEAADVVNAVTDAYVAYTSKQRRSTASDMVAILQKAKDERENELSKKTAALIEFNKKNGEFLRRSGESAEVTNPISDRLAALSQAMTAAQLSTLSAKAAYDELAMSMHVDAEKLRDIESTQAIGSAASTADEEDQLRQRIFVQQSKLQDLRRTYLPSHPLCKATQKQVDDLTLAYVAAVHRRWSTAMRREEDLKRTIGALQAQAAQSDATNAEYARLQSDLKQAEKSVEMLDGRIKEIDLTDAGTTAASITVVEPAAADESVSKPAKAATLGWALLMGFACGIVGGFTRHAFNGRLYTVEEIENSLDAPVLGVIPQMSRDLVPSARGLSPHLQPNGAVAEACRTARAAIRFRLASGGGNTKTLMIASPLGEDGRSTFAANLAVTMAQSGDRVLLVDADLFQPSQHVIFSLGNFNGISRVLSESLPFKDAVRPTNIDGLDVLPAGPTVESPSELLNGPELPDLLGDLASKYDYVIVDAPSAANGAAARIIAAVCDATVLLMNARTADRKLGRSTLEGMHNVGANVIGVVVNELRTHDARFGIAAHDEVFSRSHRARNDQASHERADLDAEEEGDESMAVGQP